MSRAGMFAGIMFQLGNGLAQPAESIRVGSVQNSGHRELQRVHLQNSNCVALRGSSSWQVGVEMAVELFFGEFARFLATRGVQASVNLLVHAGDHSRNEK